MKKLIPFLVLLVGTAGAFAQGVVNFNNNVLISTNPAAPDVLVHLPGGAPVAGTNFVARLLWSTDGSSFTPHTANPSLFRPTGVAPAGTWIGGARTLPQGVGGVGVPITLRVQVWDRAGDSSLTYDQARAQGRLWGEQTFSYTQRISTPASPADTWMTEFTGFTLVPEPSIIGLGLIGVGALFMLRRRKA